MNVFFVFIYVAINGVFGGLSIDFVSLGRFFENAWICLF